MLRVTQEINTHKHSDKTTRFPMFEELDREDLHELAREFQGPFFATWIRNHQVFSLEKMEKKWAEKREIVKRFGFDELVLGMC